MNFKKVKHIYLKELLELYRDKRTLFTTILLPIILYPVIFIGTSSLMSRQTQKMEEEIKVIAFENFEQFEDSDNGEVDFVLANIREKFENDKNIKIYDGAAKIDTLLKDGVIHAIIRLDSINFEPPLAFTFEYRYDGSNDKSGLALKSSKEKITYFEKDFLKYRLSSLLDSDETDKDSFLTPFSNIKENIASKQQMLGMIMGKVLPYLLIMLLITGGAVVATDLVAGEKERKTLETLLVTAVSRNEIVLGKFLTIFTASIVNVIVNMASMYFSFKQMVGQAGASSFGGNIPMSSFVWVLLSLLPLVSLVSAVLLIISTYSRNMKEARSYESPMIMISMMLSMVSMFPGFSMNKGLAFVPIINISLLFKEIMLSGINYTHFGLTVGSTILLNIIAITMTIKVFSSEGVLFRTQTETSFKGFMKNKKQLLSPQTGMLFYLLGVALLYYVGFSWQREGIVDGEIDQLRLMLGLVKTQVLLIGAPVLLFVRFLYKDSKKKEVEFAGETTQLGFLRYKSTNILNLVLIPIMSIPAVIISAWLTKLVNVFFPIPVEQYDNLMGLMSGPEAPLYIVILVVAVTPAIFEELMFRGILPRFFEKQGVWSSIIITGLLFSIFHLDLYKLLPIAFLGIWLGYLLYVTKSIYAPMIAHFLNNFIAIMLVQEMIDPSYLAMLEGNSATSISILGGAVILFVALNYLLFVKNKNSLKEIF